MWLGLFTDFVTLSKLGLLKQCTLNSASSIDDLIQLEVLAVGAMVAVASKKRENVAPYVVTALSTLTHRGADAHGIGTHDSILTAKSLGEISEGRVSSNLVLGHSLSRTFSQDQPQPVLGDGFSFVFEGRLFPSPVLPEVEEILKILKPNPQKNAELIIEKLDGSYVFAVVHHNSLLIGRDMMGTSPLYYGENETISAVASERKALWKLDITNTNSFPPGNLAEMSPQGFHFRTIRTIAQTPVEPIGLEMATTRLQNILLEAVRKQVSDVEDVSVAFSGGLDSSVIAALAKACGKRVHLITVSVGSQPEAQHAKVAAEELSLFHHLQTYTLEDVEQVLPKVLWLIEEQDLVKVGVAIPFYWIAETASTLGSKILLAGQGADELFGGYQRYLRIYAECGAQAVQNALLHDAAFSYEQNFQRDNQVCSSHGIELRLPFVDPEVASFALSLPLNLKIESPKDIFRKKALRQTAQNIHIPQFIACRHRKAVQYATGVDKALRKLAQEKGLTANEYLAEVFGEVYPCIAK